MKLFECPQGWHTPQPPTLWVMVLPGLSHTGMGLATALGSCLVTPKGCQLWHHVHPLSAVPGALWGPGEAQKQALAAPGSWG